MPSKNYQEGATPAKINILDMKAGFAHCCCVRPRLLMLAPFGDDRDL